MFIPMATYINNIKLQHDLISPHNSAHMMIGISIGLRPGSGNDEQLYTHLLRMKGEHNQHRVMYSEG